MGEFPGLFPGGLSEILSLGVKDLFFWVREARRSRVLRRIEDFNTVLIPYQGNSKIQEEARALTQELADLELEQDGRSLEEFENDNAALIAAAEEKAKARRLARRARIAAGEAPPPRRKVKRPKHARRLI